MSSEKHSNSAALGALKDLTAGTVGGMAQTVVGHPFNTLKVRLQTQPHPPKYHSGLHCFKLTVKEEGFMGLYKGITPPLFGIGMVNAVLFYSNEAAKRAFRGTDTNRDLTVTEICAAGAFSGVVGSVVVCPVELLMVRLQTQHVLSPGKLLYTGPLDCAQKMIRAHGVWGGLYKGFGATVIRSIPDCTAYFGTYELLKQAVTPKDKKGDIPMFSLFMCGGFAGVCAQLTQLPFDRVKSFLQTQSDTHPTYRGFSDCLRGLVRQEGFFGLYKGIGPVLVRAFPANAACFLAFEYTKKALQ
eukprot:GDKI01005994.1.p1 GENE.GDKI01005994.1~~GDKI01005994.1.p1  ORF type:complete len:299 (-),score=90.42 GDKI01005994.1:26-922(-)